ncbi:MAG TPA: MEDS domain-containing protein [Chloroflexota bacterium]|nr:MEDS domain-containing protein [Chloroflexota bacterium]
MDPQRLAAVAHSVEFYADDAHLLNNLTHFVRDALLNGQSVVVVATEAHRTELALRLEESALPVGSWERLHRYIAVDAEETLRLVSRAGMPHEERFRSIVGVLLDEARDAASDPALPVAVFGEMVVLLQAAGKTKETVALERLWNALAESHSFILRCAYPLSLFPSAGDGDALQEICGEHSTVIPTQSYAGLTEDSERLRAIAILEQKALALETALENSSRLLVQEQAARTLAQTALESRDEFFDVAAHELKTPITILKAGTQLLQKKLRQGRLDQAQLEERLAALDQATDSLTAIVNDVLRACAT